MGTYVVLGGTGAVGSALVEQLVASGHQVTIGVRNVDKARRLQERSGCDVCRVTVDDSASIAGCVSAATEKYGQLNGAANCIGSILLKPTHSITDEQWQESLTTNLTSSFYLARAAVKVLRDAGGSIVLVSSVAARYGMANHEAVAAAKAGVEGLTLSLAATYASRNVRVNAVAPGLVKSEMTRSLWGSEANAKASEKMHPLGRLGEPIEVARAIAWLLEPAAGWITGQVIGIDGGLGSVASRR